MTLAQVTSLPFFGYLVVKLVTYLKRIWDGFGSVLGQKGIKKPGKPINKGFPGVSQAQLDRARRVLAVCWRSIPSHRSETSRWSVLRDKKESVCSCKHGIRSLLLSLHPLRVCHFCVKVHSLLSLILYDESLVVRIYSGYHYKLNTIYIHIVCTILFYQNFFGQ